MINLIALLIAILIAVWVAAMKNQPASKMIRVPTPLIKFVNELSRLYRQGKKEPLYQGLRELIARVDSSCDINEFDRVSSIDSNLIADLIQRIERLESKLEQTDSVSAISFDSSFKNEGGVTQGELAKRLGCDSSTLTKNRKKRSFDEWSRSKDPEGKAWRYLSDMQRYGVVQDKSS